MDSRRLRILPAALEELKSAVGWYMGQNPTAADKFEVDRAVELITRYPMMWPMSEYSTRKFALRRFPFAVIYRTAKDSVEVLAFAHGHRRPDYWRDRL